MLGAHDESLMNIYSCSVTQLIHTLQTTSFIKPRAWLSEREREIEREREREGGGGGEGEGYISGSKITVEDLLRVEVGHGCGYLDSRGDYLPVPQFTTIQDLKQRCGYELLEGNMCRVAPKMKVWRFR